MIDLDILTTFLGWCTVINFGILIFAALLLVTFKAPILEIHSKFFAIHKDNLEVQYFQYLGNYKIAIFIFNAVPYFALKIMA